ncbi:MAG: flagellar biosynthetic protein FliO [Rhodothermus sp.]|nr:flagellar biosynthetic protein FliO [Rhodothermus sp.]
MAIRFRMAARVPVRRLVLFGAGLFLLWLALQWAASPVSSPTPKPFPAPDSTYILPARSSEPVPIRARYVVVLLILIAGAFLALYWYRRQRPPNRPALLRPVGQLSLGPGQQIRLIACGDELLILGVTSHQITLLKSLPLPPELQANRAETDEALPFAHLVTHLTARTPQTDHAS